MPDLPKANYNVWVRGYGLVDSPKVVATPGKVLNLTASVAPTPQAAAQYYPAELLAVDHEAARGRRQQGRAASAARCGLACHQMGGKATREIPPELVATQGPFTSTADAWLNRVRTGPTGAFMSRSYGQLGPKLYPPWTDSILAGTVPPEPPRPAGVERNLVVTLWDWGRCQRLRAQIPRRPIGGIRWCRRARWSTAPPRATTSSSGSIR